MSNPPLTRRTLLQHAAVLAASAALPHSSEAARGDDDLVSLVNPMQGTNSNFGYSRGNTLPLVARPFGMNHWSMQTSEGDGWYFDPNAHKLQGIRSTHQPSPWIGDYGKITIMAHTGEAPVYAPEARAATYRPEDLDIHPHYLSLKLAQSDVHIEMTPTDRCGVFRFTFPATGTSRVLIDAHSEATIDAAARTITGCSRHKSGGAPNNFGCYFYAVFETPFASATILDDHKPVAGTTLTGKEVGVAVAFQNQATVTMRMATSFISVDQARLTLKREVGKHSFDDIMREARRDWNETLGVVRVEGGTRTERRTFYSCLFRAHLFPRMFHEIDGNGKTVHYSPYDGKVHPGVMYTDTGLWDGYRALYPLLSLIQPARLGEMVEGFLNAYREGGWLPQWPSPGTRGGMGGTHSDAVFADAILKDIPGYDRDVAYAAILKNADIVPGRFVFEGRQKLDEYQSKGYRSDSVSNSLDYAYDDACIALVAQKLGKPEYAALRESAMNYRHLYDTSTGFMRGRNADGSWVTPFDPYAWGTYYTEGGAWQWSWAVPHDPAGLIALMGGPKPFLAKLDRMLLQPPTFHPGGYGHPIHEMLEMAAVPFGQYDQGNQPVHQVLGLFAAAGCPWKTHYWTRRVLAKLYTPDDFPGDEDNGEMAAWYVMNALGLFPLCVGHPTYTLGSPLFREARIKLSNGKTLRLSAPATTAENVYVNGVRVNGQPHTATTITHADLMQGGTIDFAMGKAPVERKLAVADLPFAFSPYVGFDAASPNWQTEIKINCGGDEAGDWVGDCFVEGGKTDAAANITLPSRIPVSVGQSARTGSFVYRIPLPMLPGGKTYDVTLYGCSKETTTIIGDVEYRAENTGVRSVAEVQPYSDGAILITVKGRLAGIHVVSA